MIAYAKHPLSQGDKQKLRADGYKILDYRFKPKILSKGDKVWPEVKRKKKATK